MAMMWQNCDAKKKRLEKPLFSVNRALPAFALKPAAVNELRRFAVVTPADSFQIAFPGRFPFAFLTVVTALFGDAVTVCPGVACAAVAGHTGFHAAVGCAFIPTPTVRGRRTTSGFFDTRMI